MQHGAQQDIHTAHLQMGASNRNWVISAHLHDGAAVGKVLVDRLASCTQNKTTGWQGGPLRCVLPECIDALDFFRHKQQHRHAVGELLRPVSIPSIAPAPNNPSLTFWQRNDFHSILLPGLSVRGQLDSRIACGMSAGVGAVCAGSYGTRGRLCTPTPVRLHALPLGQQLAAG